MRRGEQRTPTPKCWGLLQKSNDSKAQLEHNVATTRLGYAMANSNDVVRARIDGHVKEEATNVLAGMGLSVSDAIRMLLTRIAADKALPFDINRVQAQPSIRKQ